MLNTNVKHRNSMLRAYKAIRNLNKTTQQFPSVGKGGPLLLNMCVPNNIIKLLHHDDGTIVV